ncbi:MAG: L,D-transpeptidase [Anaerolineae bacterium]|nr:L,D-transpeptidase [Anaerolineae bacterium]
MPRSVLDNRTCFSIVFAVVFGFTLSLSILSGLALAQAPTESPASPPTEQVEPTTSITTTQPLTTDFSFVDDFNYARIVSEDPVYVYSHPLDLQSGLPPTRTIESGFMFVSLEQKDPITFSNGLWYEINEDEYVPANVITYYTASTFHGAEIATQPDKPFGWVIRDTPIFTEPIDQATPVDLLGWPVARKMAGPDTPFIPRYTHVTIYETSYAGDWGWQRIGPNQWVHLYDVGKVEVMTRPTEIPAGERWIFVNLFDQTMAVYDENDQMVYATLVSTGRQVEGWRTPPGIFRIYKKLQTAPMAGGGLSDRYLLEDVTATMYFHEGYAFHAAYWHDDFGRYKSHGCVNMTPTDAEWLYNWSTPVASPSVNQTKASEGNEGTWVWIYDPHA